MRAQPYTQWEHNHSHNESTTLHTLGAQPYTQLEQQQTTESPP